MTPKLASLTVYTSIAALQTKFRLPYFGFHFFNTDIFTSWVLDVVYFVHIVKGVCWNYAYCSTL